MKHLLSFLAGVIAGVVGVFLYQVFGRPTLPSEPIGASGVGESMAWFASAGEPVWNYADHMKPWWEERDLKIRLDEMDEDIANLYNHVDRIRDKISASLEKTQPVKVEAPWNELGYDCGEPWGEPTIGGIRE